MNRVELEVLQDVRRLDQGQPVQSFLAGEPDRLMVMWNGEVPLLAEHPALAPVIVVGRLSDTGQDVYTEAVPRGVRLCDVEPPYSILPYIIVRVMEGVAALHRQQRCHGQVAPSRVVLGEDGEVVLIGGGRSAGTVEQDVAAVFALEQHEKTPVADSSDDTEPGERTAPEWTDSEVTPGRSEVWGEVLETGVDTIPVLHRIPQPNSKQERQQLAEWVRQQMSPDLPVKHRVSIDLRDLPQGSLDEVVPHLEPDESMDGLLDRWLVTTAGGLRETTDEITRGTADLHPNLALELWSRLVAPQIHASESDRFREKRGQPSEGIRELLRTEPLDPLPSFLDGPLRNFVLDPEEDAFDEAPTKPGRPVLSSAEAVDTITDPSPPNLVSGANKRAIDAPGFVEQSSRSGVVLLVIGLGVGLLSLLASWLR